MCSLFTLESEERQKSMFMQWEDEKTHFLLELRGVIAFNFGV
jgi:hypothetical protein